MIVADGVAGVLAGGEADALAAERVGGQLAGVSTGGDLVIDCSEVFEDVESEGFAEEWGCCVLSDRTPLGSQKDDRGEQ